MALLKIQRFVTLGASTISVLIVAMHRHTSAPPTKCPRCQRKTGKAITNGVAKKIGREYERFGASLFGSFLEEN